MEIKVYLVNLTTDEDLTIKLPVNNLNDILSPNCEYIIAGCDVLDPSEFDSIYELNFFLNECEDMGIHKEELEVLSSVYLYHEVMQMVKDETYIIIDFDAETSDWRNGNGGDLCNDHDKGMCLFDSGYYNPFGFTMNEDIYDWIDWESVWINALTEGWQSVRVGRNGYLVHR